MITHLLFLLFFMPPLFAAGPSEQIDFTRLIESAELANAAYLTEIEITELIRPRHYELTQYHTIPANQVSYFIATNNSTQTQVVAVRGTSNVENAIVDIALKLALDQLTGLRMHVGFSSAAKQIYSEIKPLLKKDYTINTTGHSLGGAVAMVLAKYLETDNYRVGEVITFGQPKVTNLAGAKTFQNLNITRVVTPLDLVPLVPPFDPLDINNLDIYWHSGQEVLLLEDKQYSILEGVNSMLRTTKFTQKQLTEDNLHNHKMTFYLELLHKNKLSNERVPYKNNFNLFNLFGS